MKITEVRTKPLIIHVIDSLGLGGAEKLLVNSINTLTDYEHVICTLSNINLFEKIGTGNVLAIINLGFQSNRDFFKSVIHLRKVIAKYRPDIIHAHLLKSTWISRLAVSKKYPFYFSIHNLLSEDAFKVNKLSYYVEKWTYSKSQRIIGVSKEVLKDYDKWIGIKSSSYVLYNLIEEEFFKRSAIFPNRQGLKLVAVGNLRRQKNYSNLVKAFIFLKGHAITLDIYGEGEDRKALEELIQKHNLPVELKGRHEQILEVLPGYDAYVLASSFEGYGIAAVEGMAIGLPVLLSDIPVFREVTDGKAIYFNPKQPKEIASKLLEFAKMPLEERIQIGQQLKLQALSVASPAKFRENLIRIYNSPLNRL